MRIQFKSLIVLHENSVTFGDTKRITTVYDMKSVRDHTLDLPRSQLLLHPGVWGRVALFAILPAILLLIWTEGKPWQNPLLVLGVLTPWCALFYSISYMTVKNLEMENFARTERGLAADAKVSVVENDRWGPFLAQLKEPDAVTRGWMDLDRQRAWLKEAIHRLESQK
jgi:hypothetical protein